MTFELLVVRHAVAHDRDAARWPDDADRPLTAQGEQEFRGFARALGPGLRVPARVLSSPFARAWRTAELLRDALGWPAPERAPLLEPEALPRVLLAQVAQLGASRVAVVGHQPHLGKLVSLCIAGNEAGARVHLRKGAMALLRFEEHVGTGGGELRALLDPKTLLRAAEARSPA